MREFTEECAASKEAAVSLENVNKLLEGSFVMHAACRTTDQLVTAKLTELESGHATQSVRSGATKQERIPRPKGLKWALKKEMHLENDPEQYDQIIVRVPHSLSYTRPNQCLHQRKLKNLKREAGFKDGALFSDQSKEKIVKYCRLVHFQLTLHIAISDHSNK